MFDHVAVPFLILIKFLHGRNVTISTVGVMGRIRALGSEFPFAGPNLALSLHAPTQERARSVTL